MVKKKRGIKRPKFKKKQFSKVKTHKKNKILKITKTIKKESIPGEITSDRTYTTQIDDFYEFIKKNKKVSLSNAAKYVKIDKKLAETWAKILAEHNLIELIYPLFGEPLLKCKQ